MTGRSPKANDYSTVTAHASLRDKLVKRLMVGWLLLGLSVSLGVLFFEITQLEQYVYRLALNEAETLSHESSTSMEELTKATKQHLKQLADQLIYQNFLIVELYDKDKQLQLETYRQGYQSIEQSLNQFRHRFPAANGFSHEIHFVDDQLLLVILTPIKKPSIDEITGYLEGVYKLDKESYAAIKQSIIRSLVFVTLGITFTLFVMYPVMINLNAGVVELSGELLRGNLQLMNVLGKAIAERDTETNSHNYRVMFYALRLGEAIGLGRDQLRDLIAGSFLHDVGKIGIRDPILLKPGKLTSEEFEIMKTHVTLGVGILNQSTWLKGAKEVIEFHHEYYDGSGYLKGLKGEEIPLNARIFAIADVFDALTSQRPYKSAWPQEQVMHTIQQQSGTHFDPNLVAKFVKLGGALYQQVNGLDAHQLEAFLNPIIAPYFFVSA